MTVAAESAAEAGGTDPKGTIDMANPSRRPAATAPLTALPKPTTECCLMNAFMVMSPTNDARPMPRLRHQHH
jgi:hypothetical protein